MTASTREFFLPVLSGEQTQPLTMNPDMTSAYQVRNSSIYPFVHLSIHVYVHLSIYVFIYLSICASIYPCVHLSIHVFIYLSMCSSIYPCYRLIHIPKNQNREFYLSVSKVYYQIKKIV